MVIISAKSCVSLTSHFNFSNALNVGILTSDLNLLVSIIALSTIPLKFVLENTSLLIGNNPSSTVDHKKKWPKMITKVQNLFTSYFGLKNLFFISFFI